jgi:hypothetical protein
MKKKLLVASLLAFAGTGVMAQSAFQGFYGQVGVGYESNSFRSNTLNVGLAGADPTSGTGGPISGPSATACAA